MMGYRGAAPSADDLVPPLYRGLPLKEFLARLGELDEAWRKRTAVETAHARVLLAACRT